jgi:UPF0755 protein
LSEALEEPVPEAPEEPKSEAPEFTAPAPEPAAEEAKPAKTPPGRAGRSSWTQRAALVTAVLTAVGLLVAGVWTYRYLAGYPDRPLGGKPGPVKVEIPKGATLEDAIQILEKKDILPSPTLFRIYVTQKGLAHRIKQGRYRLSGKMTPAQLIRKLVRGPTVKLVQVTIPEGKHMLEVADILSASKLGTRKELVTLMRDTRYVRRLGVPGRTLEGYLYPDTYKFRSGSSASEVLKHMVRRHWQVAKALKKQYPNGVIRLRHTYHFRHRETVIMASIVEKETGQPHERPLIAGVFLNRLRLPRFKPKRLETDPTIIYGCTVPVQKSPACLEFKGRIRTIHLRDAVNPYNTYMRNGLPPGPICNPGRAALAAVLRPRASNYLYFVSKNDGTHKFSATRKEHERAVWMYQKKK